MNKDLRTALDRCLSAMAGFLPSTYQSVLTAKVDLEVAVMTLEKWLEEHVLLEPAIYHPYCSACLRGLAHTQLEHDKIVELREKRTLNCRTLQTVYFRAYPIDALWVFRTFNMESNGKQTNISDPSQSFDNRDDCRYAALNCGYVEETKGP